MSSSGSGCGLTGSRQGAGAPLKSCFGSWLRCGLLVSILAGFKTGHGFTIVAGALVALLTTLTNALHPSQAADGYQDARLALRDQGWSLLLSTDGYANMKEDAVTAYDQFAGQIRRIVQAKRATTRFTLGGSNAPG